MKKKDSTLTNERRNKNLFSFRPSAVKASSRSGFTLIELLVVIAIIGILSSVVLASLNSARNKGSDAAVKSNLANMRAQAEILYDDNSNYASVCENGNIERARSQSQTGTDPTTSTCFDETETGISAGWAAAARLSPTNAWFCVDHSGDARTVTQAGNPISITDVDCDA